MNNNNDLMIGVACMNNGRKFIGIELDDNYFDIATKRILGEQQ